MELADFSWQPLFYAVLLLLLSVGLLVLEFFLVSFGALLVGSVAAAAAAIYFAFLAGDVIGWIFVVSTPLITIAVIRWGVKRIQTSSLVPQAAIDADAGYHHATERIGVGVGSTGVMVTRARPSGRARFDGGECDVQVQGPPLEAQARVVVKRIDGPIVFVVPAGEAQAT